MAFREALFSYEAAPPFLRRSLKRLWYTASGKAQPFRTEGGKPRFVRPEKFCRGKPDLEEQMHGAGYS